MHPVLLWLHDLALPMLVVVLVALQTGCHQLLQQPKGCLAASIGRVCAGVCHELCPATEML
jgi:hypothetical protein